MPAAATNEWYGVGGAVFGMLHSCICFTCNKERGKRGRVCKYLCRVKHVCMHSYIYHDKHTYTGETPFFSETQTQTMRDAWDQIRVWLQLRQIKRQYDVCVCVKERERRYGACNLPPF